MPNKNNASQPNRPNQFVDWSTYAVTDVGAVRKRNEDAFFINDYGAWVVADGMGGHAAGDVASQMVAVSLASIDIRKLPSEILMDAEEVLTSAHERIKQYSSESLKGNTAGTTVVSLFARGTLGICLWAGDSRLYRYRNDLLEQITEDHSYVNELVKKGVLSREEAERHPNNNVISRAVGASEQLLIDMTFVEFKEGDIYLLCSDGLNGTLLEEEIAEFLSENQNVRLKSEQMMTKCLELGAKDNVTISMIEIEKVIHTQTETFIHDIESYFSKLMLTLGNEYQTKKIDMNEYQIRRNEIMQELDKRIESSVLPEIDQLNLDNQNDDKASTLLEDEVTLVRDSKGVEHNHLSEEIKREPAPKMINKKVMGFVLSMLGIMLGMFLLSAGIELFVFDDMY